MNFFDAQDNAKRATRLLVAAYLAATLLIVAGVTAIVGFAVAGSSMTTAGPLVGDSTGLLVVTALVTTAIIVGATLAKTAALSSGGAKVALSMGGVPVSPDTRDPLRRRYRNVVEEMAIASGVSTPEIFVLEEENGINAFAAGFTPNDAAIAVTRGTLEILNRDELQGVIAHEFSHILNGDMRLNIRMMGVLYGIMVLGLLGRVILRGSRYGALSARRSKNAPAFLIIGLGLAVLGGIGVFIARLVKAAVSRRRESLADASAVQFTRQTSGIANALKKIGGYSEASLIKASDPEEVSHMLFGPGAALAGMFATHPPIVERIRALDPAFDPSDFPDVDAALREQAHGPAGPQAAGFAETYVPLAEGPVADTVGRPTPEHVELAQDIREGMPIGLYEAAHSTDDAFLLTVALVINPDQAEQQLAIVRERLGAGRATRVQHLAEQVAATGREARLPLLEIAFPALKRRPMPRLEYLADLLKRLIAVDGRTSLFEYCYYSIVINNLDEALDPTARPRTSKLTRRSVQQAALDLLRIVAVNGHSDSAAAGRAFKAGVSELPGWAAGAELGILSGDQTRILDASLARLNALNSDGKERLINAVGATIRFDDQTTHTEAELLRAVGAALNCPLPPVSTVRMTR